MADEISEAMWDAGYDALARALKIAVKEYLDLWQRKQNDYGPYNIAIFREKGCVIRGIDKAMRLKRHYIDGEELQNESVEDAWLDQAGYALIDPSSITSTRASLNVDGDKVAYYDRIGEEVALTDGAELETIIGG